MNMSSSFLSRLSIQNAIPQRPQLQQASVQLRNANPGDSFSQASPRFGAGHTPNEEAKQRLANALHCKNASEVKKLLNHIDNAVLNEPIDTKGNTFLHVAVRTGRLDLVRLLLEKGVGPSINTSSVVEAKFIRRGVKWNTPFQIAVAKGDVQMANALFDAATDYGVQEQCFAKLAPEDTNVLHLAAKSGKTPMVQWVLDHTGQALINQGDAVNYPPLVDAILSGSVPVVDLLLRNGATVDDLCVEVATEESNPLLHDPDYDMGAKVQEYRNFIAQYPQKPPGHLKQSQAAYFELCKNLERNGRLDDMSLIARNRVPRGELAQIIKLLLLYAEPDARNNLIQNFKGFSADYRLSHDL